MIQQIVEYLLFSISGHPLRVGIDGVDAAGKTTLADRLARELESRHCPVLHASIDRFHNPREVRYHRGADSPEGYFYDSYDLAALRHDLLDPLGPGGSREVRLERFDFRSDTPVESTVQTVEPRTILLFDGIFLQRPELADCWDVSIFVQVSFATVLTRAVARDRDIIGNPQAVIDRYTRRYIPAQRLYLEQYQPAQHANIVVYNDDPDHAKITFNGRRMNDRR